MIYVVTLQTFQKKILSLSLLFRCVLCYTNGILKYDMNNIHRKKKLYIFFVLVLWLDILGKKIRE